LLYPKDFYLSVGLLHHNLTVTSSHWTSGHYSAQSNSDCHLIFRTSGFIRLNSMKRRITF